MNIIPIETEKDFKQLVDSYQPTTNGSTPDITFRGQRNASWKLESTLERSAREKFGESFREYISSFEITIIDQFIERCIRFELGHLYYPNKKLPHISNTYEWLSLLQHYGNPTRLMDFTDDFWVALHFALGHSEPYVPFTIYALRMSGDALTGNKLPKDSHGKPYQTSDKCYNVNELLGLVIKFSHFKSAYGTTLLPTEWKNPKQNYGWDKPAISNVRIERQLGRFLYQILLDDKIEQISELTKYVISAKLRETVMKMFQDKGLKYSRDFLFPTFEQTP